VRETVSTNGTEQGTEQSKTVEELRAEVAEAETELSAAHRDFGLKVHEMGTAWRSYKWYASRRKDSEGRALAAYEKAQEERKAAGERINAAIITVTAARMELERGEGGYRRCALEVLLEEAGLVSCEREGIEYTVSRITHGLNLTMWDRLESKLLLVAPGQYDAVESLLNAVPELRHVELSRWKVLH
jgi:hypothetical protein